MRFADITGQEDLKRHLTQSVDAGRVSHAQLFTGTAGSGALAVAVAYVQYLGWGRRAGGAACGAGPDGRRIAARALPASPWTVAVTPRFITPSAVRLRSSGWTAI